MVDKQREPLNRSRIVSTAVRLADEGGQAAMSMRKVAAELGFEVMSLYNHVANKADLLAGMADHVAAEIDLPEVGPGEWKQATRQNAIDTKAMFERHPWVIEPWVTSLPGPNRWDLMEWQLATLAASGLDERRAHDAFHAVGNHVTGYVMFAEAMAFDESDAAELIERVMESLDETRHPLVLHHIGQHRDGDTGPSFELVLDLILDGLSE